MFLSRVLCPDGRIALALRQGSEAALVLGGDDLAGLCRRAVDEGVALEDLLLRKGLGEPVDVEALLAQRRVLCPLPKDLAVVLPTCLAGPDIIPVLPPGLGPCVPVTGALEGGIALVLIVGRDGVPAPLGWVQTQGVSDGTRAGWLICGPELCLGLPEQPGPGQARLFSDTACIAEFPIPSAEVDVALPDLPPYPPGTVILHRAARWLLRTRNDQAVATVETRILGLGLPLRNVLGSAINRPEVRTQA